MKIASTVELYDRSDPHLIRHQQQEKVKCSRISDRGIGTSWYQDIRYKTNTTTSSTSEVIDIREEKKSIKLTK